MIDVYKRQVDDDAIIGSLSSGQMNGIKAIVTFAEMLMLTSGGAYKVGGGQAAFTPVSYTHLDVYKRQGFNSYTGLGQGWPLR